MSQPFIAEIMIFGGNFAPRSWAFCNGQTLPISQNTALFSLVGTTFGGDGRTTFGIPDLKSRAPMGPGNGPGLTSRRWGEKAGVTTVTLTEAQMANHSHEMTGVFAPAEDPDPDGNAFAFSVGGAVYGDPGAAENLASAASQADGGGQAHNNRQPFLGLNFVIALQGLFPSRS